MAHRHCLNKLWMLYIWRIFYRLHNIHTGNETDYLKLILGVQYSFGGYTVFNSPGAEDIGQVSILD